MSLEKQHLTGWSSPRLKLQMFFCKAGEMQENLRCEPNVMCKIKCICNFYQALTYGPAVMLVSYLQDTFVMSMELMGVQVRIAVVGQGTGQVIEAHQEPLLHIEYTPPKVRPVCWSSLPNLL